MLKICLYHKLSIYIYIYICIFIYIYIYLYKSAKRFKNVSWNSRFTMIHLFLSFGEPPKTNIPVRPTWPGRVALLLKMAYAKQIWQKQKRFEARPSKNRNMKNMWPVFIFKDIIFRPWSETISDISNSTYTYTKTTQVILVGGLAHQFYFPTYWEFHHPN